MEELEKRRGVWGSKLESYGCDGLVKKIGGCRIGRREKREGLGEYFLWRRKIVRIIFGKVDE